MKSFDVQSESEQSEQETKEKMALRPVKVRTRKQSLQAKGKDHSLIRRDSSLVEKVNANYTGKQDFSKEVEVIGFR